MRDHGQPGMGLLLVAASAPSGKQLPYNFAYMAIHLNSVVSVAAGAVISHKFDQPWLRTDWNTAFYQFLLSHYLPNILVTHKDVGAQRYYIEKDRRESNMTYEKIRKNN